MDSHAASKHTHRALTRLLGCRAYRSALVTTTPRSATRLQTEGYTCAVELRERQARTYSSRLHTVVILATKSETPAKWYCARRGGYS